LYKSEHSGNPVFSGRIVLVVDLPLRADLLFQAVETIVLAGNGPVGGIDELGGAVAGIPRDRDAGIVRVGDGRETIQTVVAVTGCLVLAIYFREQIAHAVVGVGLNVAQRVRVLTDSIAGVVGKRADSRERFRYIYTLLKFGGVLVINPLLLAQEIEIALSAFVAELRSNKTLRAQLADQLGKDHRSDWP
jgi:hypothetical protein